jgi:hypothetical protein
MYIRETPNQKKKKEQENHESQKYECNHRQPPSGVGY